MIAVPDHHLVKPGEGTHENNSVAVLNGDPTIAVWKLVCLDRRVETGTK